MVASKNRSRGRPTKYSRSVVDEVCARLEGSDMGLARMLDESSDLPCSNLLDAAPATIHRAIRQAQR